MASVACRLALPLDAGPNVETSIGVPNATVTLANAGSFERATPVGGGGGGPHHEQIVLKALDHLRSKWNAQLRIENDAKQWAAARKARTVGKQTIVIQHSANAGQNGIGPVTQQLHVSARGLARDPAVVILRSRDFSVQRHRCLDGDQGETGFHEMRERLVELLGFVCVRPIHNYVNAGLHQFLKPGSGNQRIRVAHGGYNLLNAGFDDRVGARTCAALV